MDEKVTKNQEQDTEFVLADISNMANSISTFIKEFSAEINEKISSNELIETIKECSPELLGAIKYIKYIQKIASIPDKIFMNKIEKYCRGLTAIPIEKRQKYAQKVGKDSLNQDSVFILGILNKIEELSKIDIMITLFEAKMDEKIDDPTYRRMMLQVDRTIFSDILFLKDNICNEYVNPNTVEIENLIAQGWLFLAGIDGGTSAGGGSCLYIYTQTAKQFCNIVFANKNTSI